MILPLRPSATKLLVVSGLLLLSAAVGLTVPFEPVVPLLIIAPLVGLWLALNLTIESFCALVILSRTLTDFRLIPGTVGFAFNILIAVFIIGIALLAVESKRSHVSRIGLTLLFMASFWSIIAYQRAGSLNSGALNELVRFISIVGLATVATSFNSNESRERVQRAIAYAAIPSLIIVIIDQIVLRQIIANAGGSSFGTFSNKNVAAAFCAIYIVYCLHNLLVGKRGIFTTGLVLGVVSLGMTVSLGGLLAAASGCFTLLIFHSGRLSVASKLAWLATAAVGIAGAIQLPAVSARINQIESTGIYVARSGEQTTSINWRLANWERLLDAWNSHPLMGWGFGSTSSFLQPTGKQPHSEIVRYLVELGAIGFGIVTIIFSVLLLRSLHSGERSSILIALIVTVFVNGLVSNTLAYVAAMYLLVVIWAVSQPGDSAEIEDCAAAPMPLGNGTR